MRNHNPNVCGKCVWFSYVGSAKYLMKSKCLGCVGKLAEGRDPETNGLCVAERITAGGCGVMKGYAFGGGSYCHNFREPDF